MSRVWETSAQQGNALLLLLAIADFANDDGVAFPAVETLARKARVGESTAHRILRHLADAGELAIEVGAGRKGTNLYRVVHAAGQQTTLLPRGATAGRGPESGPVPPATRRGAKTTPEGVPPVTPEPGTEPSLTHQGARLEERASRPPTERELRAATKAALDRLRAEWLKGRAAIRSDRFIDRGALRGLEQRLAAGLARGTSERDLADAVRELARKPTGSPWYVDEYAQQLAIAREDREHERRKAEEREAANRARDAQSDRDRASGALDQARREGLRRLRVPEDSRATIPAT